MNDYSIKREGQKAEIFLFPKQEQFINSDCDEVLYGGAAGGGKVAVNGSFCLTPFGWKRAEDIKVGDVLCNPDGSHQKVILVHPETTLPRWTVYLHDGSSLDVMKEHLWLAWRSGKRKKINGNRKGCFGEESSQVVTTSVLKEWLNIAQRQKKKGHRPEWPCIPSCAEQKFNVTFRYQAAIDPYLLGILLGDGYFGAQTTLTSADETHMDSFFNSKNITYTKRKSKSKAFTYGLKGVSQRQVKTAIERLGLKDSRSWNKFVPRQFLFGTVKTRYAVLQGLMDTDGSVYGNRRIEFSSTSNQLAKDVAHLVRSLGGVAIISCKNTHYIDSNKERVSCRKAWRVEINHFDSANLFRLPRKKNKAKKVPLSSLYRRVVSIKIGKEITGRCITVSNPNGLYIADDFIVTHNSRALLYYALKRRLTYPNSMGVIFRRTFPELERSLIQKSREIYPMFGGKYNSQNHKWRFPNGSIQEFAHLENESNVYDYQSAEYQDECFDESSHFTEFMLTYMGSRCRSTIPGCKAQIRYASNPGGVGHGYLKRRFVDPYQKSKIWLASETIGIPGVEPKRLTFIPAKLKDNPALMENDPGYVRQLKLLPEKKRLALEDGRWDVYEGQFFSEWNPHLHVLKKAHKPNVHTQKLISLDWGFAEHAAVYWWEILPMGRVYIYRELCVTQRSPKELAWDIMNLTETEEEGFVGIVLPPEIFGKRVELENGGVPIADLMAEVLGRRFVILKANNARIAGWTKLREWLAVAPDGLPYLQVSPTCENLIRTLPEQIFDDRPGKEEDLDNRGFDHPADSVRYGCMALNTVPKQISAPFGAFDKVFGERKENKVYSHLPLPGRGGY